MTTDALQVELDAAQSALERHLGDLKEVVTEKLEQRLGEWTRSARARLDREKAALEKKVTDRAVRVVEKIRKPYAWLEAHAMTAAIGALVAGAALGLLRAMRRHRVILATVRLT